MPFYKPSELTFQNQRFSAILYGAPGTGKTTLACSAPKPLLIDLDRGIQRIKAQHRPTCLIEKTFEELLKDLESEEMKEFETIIIDTGGALITLLQDYVMRKDPINRTKSGTISQKGYGAVKLEFQSLTNRLKTVLNKNIIYVFHTVEEKNKDGVAVQRLLCEGSSKNIVWQPCDFGGYVFMNGDQRMIGFTPTDEYFAKGCYGINGVRKIPVLGVNDKNDYITKLFEEANANIAKDNEFFAAERETYEKAMEQGKAMIAAWKTPEEFTKAKDELKKLPHALTSFVELCAICKQTIAELGFQWDSAKHAYVVPKPIAKDEAKDEPKRAEEKPFEEIGEAQENSTAKKGKEAAKRAIDKMIAEAEESGEKAE